jgi:hypothetical protein
MKSALLCATFAASVLVTMPARAGGGFPGQFMPPYPHPSYCAQCWPDPQTTIAPRPLSDHRARARAVRENPK